MKRIRIEVDRRDMYLEDLIRDLSPKKRGLKRISNNEEEIAFYGNISDEDLYHLMMFVRMSPLGDGYFIYINGEQIW